MPKILTIERAKWRRGGTGVYGAAGKHVPLDQEYGPTKLLNDKGLMCCLGFDALACGVPEHLLKHKDTPLLMASHLLPDAYIEGRITTLKDEYGTIYSREETEPIKQAMAYNDADGITEEEREHEVRKQLLKLGWDDVVFV